jgi:hypothetical protein
MALSGSFTYTEYNSNTGSLVSSSVTYPAEMPSDHPDASKAGTTETLLIPTMEEVSTTYTGKYFYCQSSAVYGIDSNVDEGNIVGINYRMQIYDNQNHKNTDFFNPTSYIEESFDWDWNTNTNPMEAAYTHFKTLDSEHSLVNN